MTISVITVVFNDVKHIERTIRNVSNQSFRDRIEYIVIDGASSDGTSEIIRNNIQLVDKYVCEPDTGIYNAMNKGLQTATGDYVIFMNSGDIFTTEDTIEKIINSVDSSFPDVIYGDYREYMGNENLSMVIPARNPEKIWYGPVASHQSTLYNRLFLKAWDIKYDESYKIAADYKFTAQAIKDAKKILKLALCISDFDVTGVSSVNQDLGLSEANRVRKEVFGWGNFRIKILSSILLLARYFKHYAYPLYRIIRG